jgi:hypothetical protein
VGYFKDSSTKTPQVGQKGLRLPIPPSAAGVAFPYSAFGGNGGGEEGGVVEEEMVRATFIDSFDAAILIASSARGEGEGRWVGERGHAGERDRWTS